MPDSPSSHHTDQAEVPLPVDEWRVRPMQIDTELLVSMLARDGFRVWTRVRLAEPLADQVKAQHPDAKVSA